MNRLLAILIVLTVVLTGCAVVSAQDDDVIAKKILGKRYVFVPQSATPLQGSMRQLTAEYELKVLPDTINSFLPYFGRAYSAPIGASQSGISFTSTDFAYSITPRKKGGWDILIRPNKTDVQKMYLSVSSNGSATLQVTSTNRQAISFYGNIDINVNR